MIRVFGGLCAAGVSAWCLLQWWRARRHIEKMEHALEASSRNLEQLQHAFERFAPQEVVEDIIAKGASTKGERREVTVLFADLVGFTSMSERLEPEQVVGILNGYFQVMSREITAQSGRVTKFMGDGLMALFGAPDPNPWQVMDAVKAALAMRGALETYNRTLKEQGRTPLRVGIGIHCGPVVAGVLGSHDLMEYTVIGDAVNTASRIEGLTRKHQVDILISETVKAHLDGRFLLRPLAPEEVKGRQEKVMTYAVEGMTA